MQNWVLAEEMEASSKFARGDKHCPNEWLLSFDYILKNSFKTEEITSLDRVKNKQRTYVGKHIFEYSFTYT